jgi:hypothetical protein
MGAERTKPGRGASTSELEARARMRPANSRCLHRLDRGASTDELELQTVQKMETTSELRPSRDGAGIGWGPGRPSLAWKLGRNARGYMCLPPCAPAVCSRGDGLPPLLARAAAASSFSPSPGEPPCRCVLAPRHPPSTPLLSLQTCATCGGLSRREKEIGWFRKDKAVGRRR